MGQIPTAEIFACKDCGGTDWATTEMYLEPQKPRWWMLHIPWYVEVLIQVVIFIVVFSLIYFIASPHL